MISKQVPPDTPVAVQGPPVSLRTNMKFDCSVKGSLKEDALVRISLNMKNRVSPGQLEAI